jgi:peptide chain release factor 3
VTGFVFKVQANMDPQHRDRIAFMRMVSGTFKRGMKLTPSGLGKPIAVHSPILFFAQDREIADSAEAGDIIGIPNHGTLRVGDTLSERNDVRFTGLPNFAPKSCAAWCSRTRPRPSSCARRWTTFPRKA